MIIYLFNRDRKSVVPGGAAVAGGQVARLEGARYPQEGLACRAGVQAHRPRQHGSERDPGGAAQGGPQAAQQAHLEA